MYYNNVSLHKTLNELMVAIANHTPETIAAAGEEARKQIGLTEEQEKRLIEAQLYMDSADATRAELEKLARDTADQMRKNNARASELTCAENNLRKVSDALEAREKSINAREKAQEEMRYTQASTAKGITARQEFLDAYEEKLDAREAAITARETKLRQALTQE